MVYFKKNMTFAIVFLTRDSRKHTSWGHINDEALRINSPPVNCCRCTFRKWTMVIVRHYSAAIWIKQLTFQKFSTHSIVLKRWKSHWLVYITASILCTIEARSLYVYPLFHQFMLRWWNAVHLWNRCCCYWGRMKSILTVTQASMP